MRFVSSFRDIIFVGGVCSRLVVTSHHEAHPIISTNKPEKAVIHATGVEERLRGAALEALFNVTLL